MKKESFGIKFSLKLSSPSSSLPLLSPTRILSNPDENRDPLLIIAHHVHKPSHTL